MEKEYKSKKNSQNIEKFSYSSMTVDQKKKLFLLIENSEKIIDMVNNKISMQSDNRANRKVLALNLDIDLIEKIKSIAKNKGVSSSDIANIALKQGLLFFDD
jgi:hypothetical protein